MTKPLRTSVCLLMAIACADQRAEVPSRSESNAAARAILDEVIQAVGGQPRLDSVRTLAVQYHFFEYDPQPDVGRPASVAREVDVLQVRDFAKGRNMYEARSTDPNRALWQRIVMTPDTAFTHDFLTNTTEATETAAPVVARYSQTQLQWYPYLSLTEAQLASTNLTAGADSVVGDAHHDLISYPTARAEVTLFIDRATRQLTRREERTLDPDLGMHMVAFDFDDYRMVDGIPIPFRVVAYRGSRIAARFEFSDARINVTLNETIFAPPTP